MKMDTGTILMCIAQYYSQSSPKWMLYDDHSRFFKPAGGKVAVQRVVSDYPTNDCHKLRDTLFTLRVARNERNCYYTDLWMSTIALHAREACP